MKYRGFSSLAGYCANISHGGTKGHGNKNARCPLLSFNHDNIVAPNNADISKKMRYANTINFASSVNRTAAGRVVVYKC